MRVFGVIGYPLSYTLSPQIHNYVFRRLNVDAIYVPLRVSPQRLSAFVEFARDALNGFNVTMPHKTTVLSLIDRASKEVVDCGSVNTVVNKNGVLEGYNTDYTALKESLSERGFTCCNAVIIGAGGVARSSVLALRDLGFKSILVLNRTIERAKSLCELARRLGLDCRYDGLRLDISGEFDVLINATPLGVNDDFPIDLSRLKVGLVVDLPYTIKGATRLVESCRKLGIPYVDGLELLVRQALEADRLWGFEGIDWREVLTYLLKILE